MPEQALHILQVSTEDIAGGAEKVAWTLWGSYGERGQHSWLAVGRKQSSDPHVFTLVNYCSPTICGRLCTAMSDRLKPLHGRIRGIWRARQWLNTWKSPRREMERRLGIEDFNYPAAHRLLELPPQRPDIVHCHNLHGGYFDLRVLPSLSQRVPTVLTLHDTWLLSGHCAYSLECERWKLGCGSCPDLAIYPAIERDATAYNWRRKRSIYAKSRLYVATPCRWLMQKVEQSMLAPAIAEARIIPYGVDLRIFHPADRQAVRALLNVPQHANVLLFTANGIRKNLFKDYQTIRAAIDRVAERLGGQKVLMIALGEDAPPERIGRAEVRFIPYQKDPQSVAYYYQAADIYLHAAHADTFPNVILEALACGIPVVATAVGGIPEQVKPLETAGSKGYGQTEATGMLVPPKDAEGMAISIERLLNDDCLRRRMGDNAARDAQERFDLQRQVDDYLAWYRDLLRDAVPHQETVMAASHNTSVYGPQLV